MPLDKNGNGKLDRMEKIYGDLQQFSNGVWIGKYPKALSREIFSVSAMQQTDENQAAFMKWILTDGQKYVTEAGYVMIKPEQITTELQKLD